MNDSDQDDGPLEVADSDTDRALPPTSNEINQSVASASALPAESGSEDGLIRKAIELNRVCIQTEMIAIFKAPDLVGTPIYIRFKNESGADADGVCVSRGIQLFLEGFNRKLLGNFGHVANKQTNKQKQNKTNKKKRIHFFLFCCCFFNHSTTTIKGTAS